MMLIKNAEKRASLDEIAKTDWVTIFGKEKVDITKVEHDQIDKNG